MKKKKKSGIEKEPSSDIERSKNSEHGDEKSGHGGAIGHRGKPMARSLALH